MQSANGAREEHGQDNESSSEDEDFVIPFRSYHDEHYDWSKCPKEWEEISIKTPDVIESMWYYIHLDVSGSSAISEERKRRQWARIGWSNVNRDIQRQYEEREHLERLMQGREETAALENGRKQARRDVAKQFPGLVERAKELDKQALIDWLDVSLPPGVTKEDAAAAARNGAPVSMEPKLYEPNLLRFFDALFCGGSIFEVHYDTAAAVTRDEAFTEINDEWNIRDLLNAARAVKFRQITSKLLMSVLKTWSKAYKFNDLRERFLAKLDSIEADGKSRQQTFLIDTLQCFDTPDNRIFNKYWLASIYMRATVPGCYCPTGLVPIGGQDSGKSELWRLVNKTVVCREDAATVPFDPSSKDKRPFLRAISGRSFIAHMGEMTNFGKINTENWKEFSARVEDPFDKKYRDDKEVKRQWIFGGDANEYNGFWRDNSDTDASGVSQGERRLYPMFVFQNKLTGTNRWDTIPGKKLPWTESPEANAGFVNELLQALKETGELIKEIGMNGYLAICKENVAMVRRFSAAEKARDEGTVRVGDFDEAFGIILSRTERHFGFVKVGDKQVVGIKFFNSEIKQAYSQFMPGGKPISPQSITKKMVGPLVGAKAGRDPQTNVTCYVFDAMAVFGDPMGGLGKTSVEWNAAFIGKFVSNGDETLSKFK
jgi:Virulence-associated protein E